MGQKNGYSNTKILTLLAGFCLIFAFVYFHPLTRDPSLRHSIQSQFKAKLSRPTEMAENSRGNIASSALTDSILSVVRNYYVDAERVENRMLLDLTLKSLNYPHEVETESNDTGFWIRVGDHKESITVPSLLKKEVLTDIFQRLALLLDYYTPKDVSYVFDEKGETTGMSRVLNAMLFALDAHSSLLSPAAYKELKQGTEGSFGGLGLLVGMRDNILTVIKPLPNSPAFSAGIKKQDRILSINGANTFGYSLDEMVEHMKGDPGTMVHLSLLRDGTMGPIDLELMREIINVDSVNVKSIKRKSINVLSLEIDSFATRTSREVYTVIKNEQKRLKGKLNGVILDLRSNPGGLLDQAVETADLFLKSGVIVATKGRKEEVEKAVQNADEIDVPVIILINSDSASASEIVAGALQDNNKALIIGQPSFGKGSVQTIFELPGERALKLTIARYYTPLGRSIQNVGIMPDIWLQPVYKLPSNENLLGLYRYQNEGFLENHLERSETFEQEPMETEFDSEEGRAFAEHRPSIKSYYLAKIDERPDTNQVDRELELALQVFEKVTAVYGSRIPVGGQRASHWLGLAAPTAKKQLNKSEEEVKKWLAGNYKLDWTSGEIFHTPNVQLDIEQQTEESVRGGDKISFAWSVKNSEATAIGRSSLFVRSYLKNFETQEILIGRLDPGEVRNGELAVKLPPKVVKGLATLWFSLAIEGEPIKAGMKSIAVKVIDKPEPKLTADTKLEHESILNDNALESNEKAQIQVAVHNPSKVQAKNLTVRLINLGGSQVVLDQEPKSLDVLEPGEAQAISINVSGSNSIVSSKIPIGLEIESEDLLEPIRKSVFIKGRLSPKAKEKAQNITHH